RITLRAGTGEWSQRRAENCDESRSEGASPPPCPLWVDAVEKGFCGGSPSNIDSRPRTNAQSRFKNLFAGIPSFQIRIPQLLCGDFFNSIGQPRSSAMSDQCPDCYRKRPCSEQRWMAEKCHEET